MCVNKLLLGQNKARQLLRSCERSGFIEQHSNGKQGGEQRVLRSITEMGIMHVAPDEETVEAAIETLFPPIDWPQPPPAQPALPPAPRQRRSRTKPIDGAGFVTELRRGA
jgi:hypothetical protein